MRAHIFSINKHFVPVTLSEFQEKLISIPEENGLWNLHVTPGPHFKKHIYLQINCLHFPSKCFYFSSRIFQQGTSPSLFAQSQSHSLAGGKGTFGGCVNSKWDTGVPFHARLGLFSDLTTASLTGLGELIQHLHYCFRVPPQRTRFLQVMKHALKRERAFTF